MPPLFSFWGGPATDMLHLPKLAAGGTIMLGATLIWASWTDDFNMFLLSMAMIGIFTATIPAAMLPHISAISPRNKQAVYIGSLVAAGPMGIIFGRVAMGLMTAAIGWQFSFRLYAAVLLFLAGLAWVVFGQNQKCSPGPAQNIFRVYANSMGIMVKPETASCLLVGFGLFFATLGALTFLTHRLSAPPFNWTSAQVGWISFAGITALVAPFSGILSRRVGGGSLSSFILGPVWRSQGWHGIAVICSASMALSFLIMTMRAMADMNNAMRCEVIGAK